ncbi:MAG TPA: penicillin-binding protein 2 [Solirubrobacteraceae bacterium]|nr:penicillin-binding protein 2 [Solirubrobacteraceae bacterium]
MALVDRRIGLLFLAFLGLLGIAVTRALYLGALQSGSLKQAAVTQQVVQEVVPAPRGTITDSSGVQLAISESADDIVGDPYLIKHPHSLAVRLAPLLGRPVSAVYGDLVKPHTGFVYLAHQVPVGVSNQIEQMRINGLNFIPTVRRFYPLPWEASQVLGYVGEGDRGLGGLEYLYNGILRGHDGIRRVVNDAIGQPISVQNVRPVVAGSSLRLTINSALQAEVEQVLAGVGAQYQPKGATAIVMNPNTGAILALANWPRVDSNNPFGAPPSAWEDQAVGFSYEPGSTFKAFTVSGAIQDGLITPNTPFNIPSILQVADRQIHDAEAHGDETLTVAQILKVSSNIGADEIGLRLGARRFDYWVHRFGFGQPTGVDLPGEQPGIVLHWWQYSGASMGNLPFGQGESVTPMQLITAYAAIANGGILRPPHVVAAVGSKSTRIPAGHRIISPRTAAELRSMLVGVYGEGGTASGAGIPGYVMAGKTGTANIAIGGRYSDSAYVASFVGMVPASHPQLLGLVVVDQPHGSIYGGSVAAPAFQKIVGWAVPYFGISPR